MDNKQFGNFVRTLREQRKSYWHSWTQEYLAEKAEIESEQVARIEQGLTKKLEPYLDKLANAFSLNELQKVEFWALAGYNYQRGNSQLRKEEIYQLLEQFYFPASARTPLWDFIGFNCYHEILWGYTPENIEMLNTEIGPNLLRVLFDEQFSISQTSQLSINELASVVAAFRTTSFRYITTKRYHEIVNYMTKNYSNFEDAWQIVDKKPPLLETFGGPVNRVQHPKFGEIDFISLHLPSRHVGNGADVFVYVPVAIDKYIELRTYAEEYIQRTGRRVYKFRDQRLE
jgi:transcriptional regulator with XRE-family HTH domain